MILPLVLDFIVIALLVVTIAYAVILNRKLAMLHNGKEELRNFLERFARSLTEAKAGVNHLQKISYETSKDMQEKIHQAKLLRDELELLVESGGKKTIGSMRVRAEPLTSTTTIVPPPTSAAAEVKKSFAAKDVSKVPKGPPKQPPQPRVEPRLVQALRGLR